MKAMGPINIDYHVYLMDIKNVDNIKLDSKFHDCIITISSQDDFLQYNTATKLRHTFGFHLIYGKFLHADSNLTSLMSLLNKPIYFYSNHTHDHAVLCPRINNAFWTHVHLNHTSKLCPWHPFEDQIIFLGENSFAGLIPSEWNIVKIIALRIFKAKLIEPVLGIHSPLHDGIVLPNSNDQLVIDGFIQINGGYQMFIYNPDLEVSFPSYSLEFAMFSRYPINIMSWDSIIRVFDATVWYSLLGTLIGMSLLFYATHNFYR